jgi:hypothetical protein
MSRKSSRDAAPEYASSRKQISPETKKFIAESVEKLIPSEVEKPPAFRIVEADD